MKGFLVVGLGAFGGAVAKTLHSMGHTVLGIDNDPARVVRAQEFTTEVIEADATNRQVMESLDLEDIEAAVVGVGRKLDSSILVSLFLKELGVEKIVAKVLTEEQARILQRLGVNNVVFPEADSGGRVGFALAKANVVDLLPLGDRMNVLELAAPEKFFGKTLDELKIRNKYSILVIAIRRKESGEVEMAPGAESKIEEGDVLIILGREEAVQELSE